MKIQLADDSLSKFGPASDKGIRLQGDLYDDVMRSIEAVFGPSVLVGSLRLWHGRYVGYKYFRDFGDFQKAVAGYENILIRQIGTRLYFALIHHDGRHEAELRRFTDYGNDNLDKVNFDDFNQAASKFICRHTKAFGKIAALVK
jgi:hypothetical protein